MFLQKARIICNLFFAVVVFGMAQNGPRRNKLKQPFTKETVRMTFEIDWHTSRVIKERAKHSSYYLPGYIAELVRRGLVDARPIK